MAERSNKKKSGIWQPIVGYHCDEEGDWVAELGCLHYQHVRHDPPWTNREWVLNDAGRQSKLGRLLNCVKCLSDVAPDHGETMLNTELRVPSTLTSYRKTPVFEQHAVPNELTREHATAKGVWALLHVLSGSLKFCISENGHEATYEITPDAPRVIPEEQPHFIIVEHAASFQLEFFRRSGDKRAYRT